MPLPKSVGQDAVDVLVEKIKDKARFELDLSYDEEGADIDGALISFDYADHPISSGAQQMGLYINTALSGGLNTIGIRLSTGQGLTRAVLLPQKAYVDTAVSSVQSSITTIQQALATINNMQQTANGIIGEVVMWLAADDETVPQGFIKCRGQTLDVADYQELFNVLVEIPAATRATWGSSDWVNQFDLPNISSKYPRFFTPVTGGTSTGTKSIVTAMSTNDDDTVELIGLIRYTNSVSMPVSTVSGPEAANWLNI